MAKKSNQAEVGIIGVGAMGMAVAGRLISNGISVTGFRRGSMQDFAAAGGIPAESISDAAAIDPLILLLPGDLAVADVMTKVEPVLRVGQRILCLGAYSLSSKEAAASCAARRGAVLIEGDISGTPAMVRAHQATLLIGGGTGKWEDLRPLLDCFVRRVTHVGSFGSAAKMKLLTNYLVGVHTVAAAEAMFLGVRLGLDPNSIIDAIVPSAGGSTMLAIRGPAMCSGDYDEGNMAYFMRFFSMLRAALPVVDSACSPLLDFTEQIYRKAVQDGHGNRDIASIYEYFSSQLRKDSA